MCHDPLARKVLCRTLVLEVFSLYTCAFWSLGNLSGGRRLSERNIDGSVLSSYCYFGSFPSILSQIEMVRWMCFVSTFQWSWSVDDTLNKIHPPFWDHSKRPEKVGFSCELFQWKTFLGCVPPTRQTVARQLKRLTKKHSKLLKTTLEKIDSLALTADFWADKKQNSYLCLTGHFVNEKYDLDSTILSFKVFEGQHTGERIGNRIEAELKHLQVYEKTTTITCDGASNMRKSLDCWIQKDCNAWHTSSISSFATNCVLVWRSARRIVSLRRLSNRIHLMIYRSLRTNLSVSSRQYRSDPLEGSLRLNTLPLFLLLSAFQTMNLQKKSVKLTILTLARTKMKTWPVKESRLFTVRSMNRSEIIGKPMLSKTVRRSSPPKKTWSLVKMTNRNSALSRLIKSHKKKQ